MPSLRVLTTEGVEEFRSSRDKRVGCYVKDGSLYITTNDAETKIFAQGYWLSARIV